MPPTKKHPGSTHFFIELVDPCRKRLASTAYFAKPGFSFFFFRLNRKKNPISESSDSRVIFELKLTQFLMNFPDNSKNKNRKIDFSLNSADLASFMKVGSKLRKGGGLHTLVGT